MDRFGFRNRDPLLLAQERMLDISLENPDPGFYPFGTNVNDQGLGTMGTMGVMMEAAGVGRSARRPAKRQAPSPEGGPTEQARTPDFATLDDVIANQAPIKAGGEAPGPGLMSQLGSNFNRNVGGLGGALMSAGQMFGTMAAAAARGGPGGVGNAVAEAFGQSAAGLGQSFAQNRARVDEIETRKYIGERLDDPSLEDDERRILEAYQNGDRDLATLQLTLERYRAARGPKPLTREQQRLDSQRRNRWTQFAKGEAGDIFSPDMLGVEGSILNDSLKQFHGESDAAYQARLDYAAFRGDIDNAGDAPLTFEQWLEQEYGGDPEAGGAGNSFLTGDSGSVTEEARRGAPMAGDPLDDLEASLMGDVGVAPAGSFAQRVTGSSLQPASRLSGQTGISSSFPPGTPSRSTLRREADLQGRLNRARDNFLFGPEGGIDPQGDPYLSGVRARHDFMNSLTGVSDQLMGIPGDFRRAWGNSF